MKLFPFFNRKPDVDFVSPLPLEECQARLFDIVDRQHRLPLLVDRPITRRLNDSDFYLARHVILSLARGDPDWGDMGGQPVLYCHLISRVGNGVKITGGLGYYSLKHGLVLSFVALWLMSSLCIALGLAFAKFSGSMVIAWALMIIPFVGPLMLVSSYLHERIHLPYLTVYLRRVLLDPSLDSNVSQFSRVPYSRFARGLQIVLFLMTGSVIGMFIFLLLQRSLT